MSTALHLASDLSLPRETTPTQRLAFLGRTGSGKSYGASKLIEELIGRDGTKAQAVIVDPVGVWHGLRLAADGKSAGIPIPVLGGMHGDVPLERTGGGLVADLVVDTGQSLILDVSEMSWNEMHQFVAGFGTRLLARKKRQRSPILTVWEEAQEFIPEAASQKGTVAPMVGAMKRLAKVGRNFGVGILLITQRPQAVSKEVLNMSECLFVYQTSGPQERDALGKWIKEKGLDTSLLEELPSLKQGTGVVWSPTWLEKFQRVRVLPKWTYDASATPTSATTEARPLAPIDLGKLRKSMAATIESAKASDPTELRRRIAELERQLATRKAPPAAKVETKTREVPVLRPAEAKTILTAVERLERYTDTLGARLEAVHEAAVLLEKTVRVGLAPTRPAASIAKPPPSVLAHESGAGAPRSAAVTSTNGTGLTGDYRERAMKVIATLHARGITPTMQRLAAWLRVHHQNGALVRAMSSLRAEGALNQWIRTSPVEPLPSGEQTVFGRLESYEPRVLELARDRRPATMMELAGILGVHHQNGALVRSIAHLRKMGVLRERGRIEPTEALFR